MTQLLTPPSIRKPLSPIYIVGFAALLAVALQGFAYIANDGIARVEERAALFEHRTSDLLESIGYSGLVHNFKNCVLRPAEPDYCERARENALEAQDLLAQISNFSNEAPFAVQLDALSTAISEYQGHIDDVLRLHAQGVSVRTIDEAVRVDDALATAVLSELRVFVADELSREANALRFRVAIAGMTTVVALVVAFAVLVNFLRREDIKRQTELSALNGRLDAVLTAADSGIIGLDEAGMILTLNPRARHLLAIPEQATPMAWPQDIVFLDAQSAQPIDVEADPLQLAMQGQALQRSNLQLTRRRGGPPRYVRVTTAPVHSAEMRDVRSVIVLDDITEQEKNRQQVERSSRLDALGQLTGGIAHDFNNLLATIDYSLQLSTMKLREAGVTLVDDYLERAKKSVRHGSSLTRRLTAFAKHEPRLAASHQISQVLDDFESLAKPTIEASVSLTCKAIDEGLWVYCDAAQLENALLNLILNSRNAIAESGVGGAIKLEVRELTDLAGHPVESGERSYSFTTKVFGAGRGDSNDDYAFRYIEFAVSDDGPGMSEEVLARAVDPFFTTKSSRSGTGLGLAMVYGFAQQSNGKLRIYSEVGQGTVVRLILPRGTPAGEREKPVARGPAPKGSGQRLLIAEDEASLLETMTDLVASLGYEPVGCSSGIAALDLLTTDDKIEAVLTDIVMPGEVGGFELAKRGRELRPDLPIIYMSGYTGFSSEHADKIEAPMLSKPCSLQDLAVALQHSLGSRQLQDGR